MPMSRRKISMKYVFFFLLMYLLTNHNRSSLSEVLLVFLMFNNSLKNTLVERNLPKASTPMRLSCNGADFCPLSLGIETSGGVFTKLIPHSMVIPTRKSQM